MTRKNDSSDACPFPPDKSPPPKTMSTNLLEYTDRFFEGWRNTMLAITIASLVLAYSLVSAIPLLAATLTIPQSWGRTPPRPDYMRDNSSFTPSYEFPQRTIQQISAHTRRISQL